MLSLIKSHLKISILVLFLISIGIYFYFGSKKIEYTEHTVVKSDLAQRIELSGKILAKESATLRFGTGGLVTYIGAKEGDSVKKWQTIASIDTRLLQKTLEQKLNLYSTQRNTFDQTIDDNNNSVLSGELGNTLSRLLSKNQYQLENTVKDVEYQDLQIKLSRIYAPFSGVLTKSPVNVASTHVGPTDTWILVNPESLYFSADLDETDLDRIKIGQKTTITLDAFPEDKIDATVDSIPFSPKETTSGTTYEVKFELPKETMDKIRLGLNGTSSIILNKKEGVFTIPAFSITTKAGKPTVTIKDKNKYIEKTIEIGIEENGQVEIISGLGEQDHVYVKK